MTYTATLRRNNAMLETMQTTMEKLSNTLDTFSKAQTNYTTQVKKTNSEEEKMNRALETREKRLTRAIELLNDQKGEFEILSGKSFKAFRNAGGNAFEFLDLALSSLNQRVKIFGIEAGLSRKIMYGFLPPGMFRMVNKFSTVFRFLGGAVRGVSDEGEKMDNIFSKSFRGLIKFPKLLGKTMGDFKGSFEKFRNLEQKRVSKSKTLGKEDYSKEQISKEQLKITDARRAVASGQMSQQDADAQIQAAEQSITHMKEVRKQRIKEEPRSLKASKFLGKLKALPLLISKSFQFFGKVMFYFTLFLTIAYILWKTIGKTLIKTLKTIYPAILQAASFAIGGIMLVWEGIQSIFKGFFGADGSLNDVIDGLINIAFGVLQFALGVAGTLLVALGGFVIEFIGIAFDRLISFIGDAFKNTKNLLKALPAILLVVGGIIALIMGAPIWLAVTISIVLYKVAAWIVKKIKGVIPGFSSGGTVSTGMQIVGEKGPELVSLPKGSRVHSNSQSKKMVSNSNPVNNFNITINAKDTSDAELRRIAQKVGNMINNSVNRSTSSSSMR